MDRHLLMGASCRVGVEPTPAQERIAIHSRLYSAGQDPPESASLYIESDLGETFILYRIGKIRSFLYTLNRMGQPNSED